MKKLNMFMGGVCLSAGLFSIIERHYAAAVLNFIIGAWNLILALQESV